MNVPDYIPSARQPKGRGPATKKQMKKKARSLAAEAKLEFPQEEERRPRRERDDD